MNSVRREEGFYVVNVDAAYYASYKQAGLGVFFNYNHPWNRSIKVSCDDNNEAELQAAILGLGTALKNGLTKIRLYTDSNFVVQMALSPKCYNSRFSDLLNKGSVQVCKAQGHSNNEGNTKAHELARAAY